MKHCNRLLNSAWLWTVAALLAGCTLLAPIPDRSRFFVLTAMAPGEAGAPANQAGTRALVLGLGPIRFPDYLDRTDIVTRMGANRLLISQNDHWAEPLRNNFARVLAHNLSSLLGTQQIVSQGNAHLAARWTINDPASGRILDRGETDLSASGGASTDEQVAALSQTLTAFSRQLAAAVAQTSVQKRPLI